MSTAGGFSATSLCLTTDCISSWAGLSSRLNFLTGSGGAGSMTKWNPGNILGAAGFTEGQVQNAINTTSGISNAELRNAINGVFSGINTNGGKISNLGNPTAGSDAATKGYVDAAVATAASSASAAGGTINIAPGTRFVCARAAGTIFGGTGGLVFPMYSYTTDINLFGNSLSNHIGGSEGFGFQVGACVEWVVQ